MDSLWAEYSELLRLRIVSFQLLFCVLDKRKAKGFSFNVIAVRLTSKKEPNGICGRS